MKLSTTLSLIAVYISVVSCRPQTVQIERQHLLHLQRSISQEPYQDRREMEAAKRGSMEETRRILQEIDRINVALGYTKRMSLAFPRVASGEGYFYPRQQFRPEFLTKRRENFGPRINFQRAIYPFNTQNFYYPAPYLQLPLDGKAQAFKTNKYFYPLVYAPLDILNYPMKEREFNGKKYDDKSIKLGTIVVLPRESNELSDREAKAIDEAIKKIETEKKTPKNKVKPSEESLIDQLVNYVPDALGLSDDYEDDRQVVSTTRLPSIKNDKFLNLSAKKHPHENIDDDRKLPPPLPINANRAFNFSNPIEKLQNFTKQFATNSKSDSLKETTTNDPNTLSPEDLEDELEEKAENVEDQKSPFGFAFGPKQQLQTFKEGGLIIQRLKVRRGGIAIAGPGGVATAGSGGTAIVGPNGIAFTHPRGLAIGGPGSRIYSVPESTDLETLALNQQARNLEPEGVLVARGPAIYYNEP